MNITSNNLLIWALQLAGLMHYLLAFANFFLPSLLEYGKNLAKVSTIVRQIFLAHSGYIVLTLLGFGTICLAFPTELLSTEPLARFMMAFLAFFWTSRIFVQIYFYDAREKGARPLFAFLFLCLFIYVSIVFIIATLHQLPI